MPVADDLNVMPAVWSAGEWTRVTFSADAPLSVFVPHFLRDVTGGYVQNGTVLNLDVGDEVEERPTSSHGEFDPSAVESGI